MSSSSQSSPTNLDEYDLTALNRHTTCAILLPESSSAKNSAHLAENSARVTYITPRKPLVSLTTSGSEDERSTPQRPSGIASPKKQISERHAVLVLKQSRDNEKFEFGSFGSSSSVKGLRTSKTVVLKHIDSDSEGLCYINLLHLELYPDPDVDALLLHNRSTSDFTAQPILKPQAKKIKPGQQATLDKGTWRLTLGRGLVFQIKVLSRTLGDLYHAELPLSSSVTTSSKTSTSTARPPLATVSTKVDRSKKKNSEARHKQERANVKSGKDDLGLTLEVGCPHVHAYRLGEHQFRRFSKPTATKRQLQSRCVGNQI